MDIGKQKILMQFQRFSKIKSKTKRGKKLCAKFSNFQEKAQNNLNILLGIIPECLYVCNSKQTGLY